MKMVSWQPFYRILKRLNVINIDSEYFDKRVNLYSDLATYNKRTFYRELRLEISDVKKRQFCRKKSLSHI